MQAKKGRALLKATAGPHPLPCPAPADQAASLVSTSLWPRGRCRWLRKPCRTSATPCAATWTSRGPRATACSESSAGCWPAKVGGWAGREEGWAGCPGPGLSLDTPGEVGRGGGSPGLAWPGRLFGPAVCLPRRCWTRLPSPCMSSGRTRPPGEGRSGGLTFIVGPRVNQIWVQIIS